MLKVYHTLQLPFATIDIVELNGKVSSIEELPDFRLLVNNAYNSEVGLRFYNQDPCLFTDTTMYQNGMHSAAVDRVTAAQNMIVEGLKYAFSIASRTELGNSLGNKLSMPTLTASATRAMWEAGFTEPDVHSRVFWSNEIEDVNKNPRLRLQLGKGVSFITFPLDHTVPRSIKEHGILVGYSWFDEEVRGYITRQSNYKLFRQFLTPEVLQEAYLKALAPIAKHIGSIANPAMQLDFNPNVFLEKQFDASLRPTHSSHPAPTSNQATVVSTAALASDFSMALHRSNVNGEGIIREQLPLENNVMKYVFSDGMSQAAVAVESSPDHEGTWRISFYTLAGLLELDYQVPLSRPNLKEANRCIANMNNVNYMRGLTFSHVTNPTRSKKVAELASKIVINFLSTKRLPDILEIYSANVELFGDFSPNEEPIKVDKTEADNKLWNSLLTLLKQDFYEQDLKRLIANGGQLKVTLPEQPVPDEPSLRYITIANYSTLEHQNPWVSVEVDAAKGQVFINLYKDAELCKLDHAVFKQAATAHQLNESKRLAKESFCLVYTLSSDNDKANEAKQEAAELVIEFLMTGKFPMGYTHGTCLART